MQEDVNFEQELYIIVLNVLSEYLFINILFLFVKGIEEDIVNYLLFYILPNCLMTVCRFASVFSRTFIYMYIYILVNNDNPQIFV